MYFRNVHKCLGFLDVGCGPGGQVQKAAELGYRAIGLDVDPLFYRHPNVALMDLCSGPVILPAPADLVWSVEVAEHLPPECADLYVETLVANTRVFLVMTASNSPGPWHMNPQPIEYWERRITAAGLMARPDILAGMLGASSMEREFLRTTGRVFSRVQA